MAKVIEHTPAPIERGDAVRVVEAGRRPWVGVAQAVKWSPVSGWWVDVAGPDGTWVLHATDVEVVVV